MMEVVGKSGISVKVLTARPGGELCWVVMTGIIKIKVVATHVIGCSSSGSEGEWEEWGGSCLLHCDRTDWVTLSSGVK